MWVHQQLEEHKDEKYTYKIKYCYNDLNIKSNESKEIVLR